MRKLVQNLDVTNFLDYELSLFFLLSSSSRGKDIAHAFSLSLFSCSWSTQLLRAGVRNVFSAERKNRDCSQSMNLHKKLHLGFPIVFFISRISLNRGSLFRLCVPYILLILFVFAFALLFALALVFAFVLVFKLAYMFVVRVLVMHILLTDSSRRRD